MTLPARQILIVDDSGVMRKIITKILRDNAYTGSLIEAEDGIEAFDAFKKHQIDLILCDWNMPSMSGLDFAKLIRRVDPERKIPIFMITTQNASDRVSEALMIGIQGYVVKPFTAEAFYSRVKPFV